MSVRRILTVDSKDDLAVLKTKSTTVEAVDDGLRALMDDMLETMYAAPGIGLAAIQVGEPKRIVVMDLAREGEIKFQEGCLSFPGASENVERSAKVRVRAQDRDGKVFEIEAEGLLAVALQHEYDHLQGVLMIDHLGPLKKRVLHRKMQKRASEQMSA